MSCYVNDFGADIRKLFNEVLDEDCCECDFSDMVQALKSDNSLIAIREDGKMYEYCDCLFEVNKDNNKEWIPRITPKVDYKLISSEYLVTSREHWEDITPQELLKMIANDIIDNSDNLRVVSGIGTVVDLSLSSIKMLSLREILDYDWQILIKIDLD